MFVNKRMERDFKGIWIPKEIYLNKGLSWSEKLLLIEIDSLDTHETRGCYASNAYLAEFLQLSPGRVANMISSLREREYLKQLFFDGHNRGLRTRFHGTANLHKSVKEPSRKSEGNLHENVKQPSRKREHSNTDLNKDLKQERGNALSIFRKAFPEYEPSPYLQDLIIQTVVDLAVWRQAVEYWAGNSYRPQSVAKLLNKYAELVAEAKPRKFALNV